MEFGPVPLREVSSFQRMLCTHTPEYRGWPCQCMCGLYLQRIPVREEERGREIPGVQVVGGCSTSSVIIFTIIKY